MSASVPAPRPSVARSRRDTLPGRSEGGVGREFIICLHRVGRLDLSERACRSHPRQHAITFRGIHCHLGESSFRLGIFALFAQGRCRLECSARSRSPLGDPVFVATPCADAGDSQDSQRNKIDAVAFPQPFQLLAPDFLVNFMKNIGHDGSQPAPRPLPGPDCAVN
jgi:hypothetical protein